MDWVPLLAALGAGSLMTVIAQKFFERRAALSDREFKERKEAYIGFLEAWRDQDKEGVTSENRYDVGHWMLRCELVGSSALVRALRNWDRSPPGSDDRAVALKELKLAMKKDLF